MAVGVVALLGNVEHWWKFVIAAVLFAFAAVLAFAARLEILQFERATMEWKLETFHIWCTKAGTCPFGTLNGVTGVKMVQTHGKEGFGHVQYFSVTLQYEDGASVATISTSDKEKGKRW